ncbi:MAG: trigger factor [Gammaproteobacteria bacterium]|nr:MAG: trigger factor [Gammaproteobacteria bacterium]
MQVSIEETGSLERRMKVQIPAEQLSEAIDERLRSMAHSVRLAGFRPGRVPMRIIRQRFGRQVQDEVANDLIARTLQEALAREGLRPAGGPRIEQGPVEPGKALEYTAVFEVYPEFEPASMAGVEIETPRTEVTEADVEAMIEKLRRQRATWESVERAAETGDRVTVDFRGTIDDEPFEGGEGEDVTLEIGSGRMVEGFEQGLVGMTPGETRTLEVTFPEDYANEKLAGRTARFEVTLKRVEAERLPELDADFARAFGIEDGSLDRLREEVRRNMEREAETARKLVIKERAFQALLDRNPLELPRALVEEEIDHLVRQLQEEVGGETRLNLPRDLFEERARRRVALGLILGEIVKRHGIVLDEDRVTRTLENIAASYEEPQEVIDWYRGNPEAMSGIRTLVLEEQVADWVLEQAEVKEVQVGFDELMELRRAANA